MKRAFACLSLALMLAGCTTFVHSELDNGSKKGLRYALPVPFLLVTPKPDGTLDNQVVYLPDPQATYVLRTKSLVSSYTLDVQLENQMLKSVSLSSKADAVAAASVETAGALAKARIEARDKEKDEAEKADADAAKAIADAELAVRVADAKVEVLKKNGGTAEAILAAQVEKEQAIVKRDALVQARDGAGANLASANAPSDSQAGTGRMAMGPMLFRIVPDGIGVKLVAVKGPSVFATSSTARTLNPLDLLPKGVIQVSATNGKFQFDFTVNRTLSSIDRVDLYDPADPGTPLRHRPAVSATTDPVGSKISVLLDPATPAGDYWVVVNATPQNGQPTALQVTIRVNR